MAIGSTNAPGKLTHTDVGAASSTHTHLYAGSATAGGSATSAVKLATARSMRVNLASTTAANFDGTAAVTPGVTGVLPVANGGTGSTSLTSLMSGMISGASEDSDVSDADFISFQDTSAATSKKISVSDFKTFVLNGTAASANKLATARTIKTNLGSTAAASFDGTANVTPGVSGVLPVANGGTGTSDGSVSGNAASATKLATSRTIQTDLGSTSSASFDGTSNISPGVTGTLPVTRGGTGQTTVANAANALINGLSALTTIADDDVIPIRDTSATGARKVTISTLKGIFGSASDSASGGTATSCTGNSATATKLANSRSVRTNLGSTTAASFDGSADITPGVTGTLALGNGGTGGTSAAAALYNLINGTSNTLSSSTVATGDYFPIVDTSASSAKKITLNNLLTWLNSNITVSSSIKFAWGTYTGTQSYADEAESALTPQTVVTINDFNPSWVVVFALNNQQSEAYVRFSDEHYENNYYMGVAHKNYALSVSHGSSYYNGTEDVEVLAISGYRIYATNSCYANSKRTKYDIYNLNLTKTTYIWFAGA